ncbi:MAG: hypothetical protein ABI606_18100 [Rhodoferax sp.]
MPALTLREFATPVRAHGSALLAGCDDPHAELLALVWGPRFDRQHAHGLLAHHGPAELDVLQTVMDAADRYDHLPGEQQHRVRRLILRHRAEVTIPHDPHSAD